MNYAIGVDIGATKTNFVLLKNLRIVRTQKIATPKSKKKLIEAIDEKIKELISGLNKSEISGIGMGVTGPLNKEKDLMLNPPNQKFLKGCPLARIIGQDLKIKTIMNNDVACFALAEATMGAGKGQKIVLGVTLGTGLGGGIIINGQLYRGFFGSAGEVGHMVIKFDGPRCHCSSFGCFEEYGSERFFKKRKASPKELAAAARKGDKKALKIFSQYGRYLGIGLSNAINVLDPAVIVLGGGIANTYLLFIKELKREIQKRVISPLAKRGVKIEKAKLGDLAGAIGAALFLCQKK